MRNYLARLLQGCPRLADHGQSFCSLCKTRFNIQLRWPDAKLLDVKLERFRRNGVSIYPVLILSNGSGNRRRELDGEQVVVNECSRDLSPTTVKGS